MPTPHGPETCYTTALPYSTVRFHSPRRYMHECRQFISRTQPHSHFSVHRRDYRARPRAQRTLKFFIEPPPQCATFPGMDLRAQSECVWKRIRSGMYTRKSGISPIWQTMEMRTLQLEAIPTLYKVLSLLRKVLQLFSSI